MTVNEAIYFIQTTLTGSRVSRQDIRIFIEEGLELPNSKRKVKLEAHTTKDSQGRNTYEIDDHQLDAFFSLFEAEQPGRHCPLPIRRALLVEARHRCGICRQECPFDFHHIVEFYRVGHYDTTQMIALCPTCHRHCGTNGKIDTIAQKIYKKKLTHPGEPVETAELIQFTWGELRDVVIAMHESIAPGQESGLSARDYSLIAFEQKNELNNLSNGYANLIRTRHLSHFEEIERFLGSPANRKILGFYHAVVDEVRTMITVTERYQNMPFEHLLAAIRAQILSDDRLSLSQQYQTLNVLLSYMYFHCDIGDKVVSE